MEKDQLVQLILDAYSARKETKEYLEFYMDPDVAKLKAKYEATISKELNRIRRGNYCKARISYIKNQIKEFSSFQPGFQPVMDLMFYTLRFAMMTESYLHFPETLMRGMSSLVKMIVDLADLNLMADKALSDITNLLSDPQAGSRYFRRYLKDELDLHMISAGLSIGHHA